MNFQIILPLRIRDACVSKNKMRFFAFPAGVCHAGCGNLWASSSSRVALDPSCAPTVRHSGAFEFSDPVLHSTHVDTETHLEIVV